MLLCMDTDLFFLHSTSCNMISSSVVNLPLQMTFEMQDAAVSFTLVFHLILKTIVAVLT